MTGLVLQYFMSYVQIKRWHTCTKLRYLGLRVRGFILASGRTVTTPEGRANAPRLRRPLHEVHLPLSGGHGACPLGHGHGRGHRLAARATKLGRGSTRTVNR